MKLYLCIKNQTETMFFFSQEVNHDTEYSVIIYWKNYEYKTKTIYWT